MLEVTISQIAIHPNGTVYGLGSDNKLYYYNQNIHDWTVVGQ